MNRQRIERAITVMERVRDQGKPFDMDDWFADNENPNDCGTAACFAGWCARDPDFRGEGLTIDRYPFSEATKGPSLRQHIGDPPLVGTPAIATFFDICDETAEWLCHSDEYPDYGDSGITPDHVINRLRYLLADGVTR